MMLEIIDKRAEGEIEFHAALRLRVTVLLIEKFFDKKVVNINIIY